MIAGVLFDMGGTLLDYGGFGKWPDTLAQTYRAVYDEVALAGYSGDPADFHARLFELEERLWRAATGGLAKPTLDDEMAMLLAELGLPHDDGLVARCGAAYGRSLQRSCEVFPDSASTLAALKAKGLRVGLISNTLIPGRVHVEDLDRYGLLPYFDDLIFSADVGLWKPQPAIFELALRRLELRPEETLFVGDRLVDDVGGAQAVGMRGVLIRALPGEGTDDARGEALGIRPHGRVASPSELLPLIAELGGDGTRERNRT